MELEDELVEHHPTVNYLIMLNVVKRINYIRAIDSYDEGQSTGYSRIVQLVNKSFDPAVMHKDP